MDIKKGDALISMAYLYQDKQLIKKHGIGVVVGEQYYRVGIAPDIGTTLNENSKVFLNISLSTAYISVVGGMGKKVSEILKSF